MNPEQFKHGVHAQRLNSDELRKNFGDLHPPLGDHEAAVAADRCLFCYDAPCMEACPTAIDIPLFIRQIQTGMPKAAAKTILAQNILGGMCARVCPTETLCQEACVRNTSEHDPVAIGLLQRYATDHLLNGGEHPFERAQPTGRKIAVIGAGPAGLSCAHRLALHGHDVVIYDARAKAGGLNEYGIATYKSVDHFSAREVDWLLKIGGIQIETGKVLGEGLTLAHLKSEFHAVFVGIGLGGVRALGIDGEEREGMLNAVDFIAELRQARDRIDGEEREGMLNAVDFIAELRQARDLSAMPIGRDVVIIGGGMTAIDAAVQAKLLGALNVTLVYRRSRERMNASLYEQDLAQSKGVHIITNASPIAVHGNGAVRDIEFEYTDDQLKPTGERFRLRADQVFKAVGQVLKGDELPKLDNGKIAVDEHGRTSMAGVWAGGDCATGGEDLTVTAVAEGRDAAEDIHATLSAT